MKGLQERGRSDSINQRCGSVFSNAAFSRLYHRGRHCISGRVFDDVSEPILPFGHLCHFQAELKSKCFKFLDGIGLYRLFLAFGMEFPYAILYRTQLNGQKNTGSLGGTQNDLPTPLPFGFHAETGFHQADESFHIVGPE